MEAYRKIPTTVSNVIPESKPIVGLAHCDAAGFAVACQGAKKRAHIITRQAVHLTADKKNVLALCQAHETWFNKQPLKIWYRFVRKFYPAQFDYLIAKAHFIIEQTMEYLEVLEEDSIDLEFTPIKRAFEVCDCSCHERYPDWYCLNCIGNHKKNGA